MTTLTIGDVTLNARAAGQSVFYLGKNGLTDWDTVTDSKSEVRERAQADGAFGISQDWRESAVISVEGWYSGSDRLDAIRAKRSLRGALSKGKPVTITLDDIDGRFSRVVSVRHVSIPDSGASPVFTFAIDTVATDPLLYGEEIVQVAGVPVSGGGLVWPLGSSALEGTPADGFIADPLHSGLWFPNMTLLEDPPGSGMYDPGALVEDPPGSGLYAFTEAVPGEGPYWDYGADGESGRLAVTNPGTAETFPRLQVTGGLGSGFIIADQTVGRTIRLDRVVPLGSTITINQRTGRVSIDGQSDVSGFLTVREFFSIGPGETHVIQFSPLGEVTGTPQLTVRTSPAY